MAGTMETLAVLSTISLISPTMQSHSWETIRPPYNFVLQGYRQQNRYDMEKTLANSIVLNTTSGSLKLDDSRAEHFNICLVDAINRYKWLNKAETYDITAAKPFLSAINCLYPDLPVITFFDDSVKARFTFNQTEFVVDYDFEEPEPVYVSAYKDDLLVFKTCFLEKLKETLEQF